MTRRSCGGARSRGKLPLFTQSSGRRSGCIADENGIGIDLIYGRVQYASRPLQTLLERGAGVEVAQDREERCRNLLLTETSVAP